MERCACVCVRERESWSVSAPEERECVFVLVRVCECVYGERERERERLFNMMGKLGATTKRLCVSQLDALIQHSTVEKYGALEKKLIKFIFQNKLNFGPWLQHSGRVPT